MTVLLLTTHFQTGGITSYLLTLSRSLIAQGHHVVMVSSGGNMVTDLEKLGAVHLTLNMRTKSVLSPKLFPAIRRIRREIHDRGISVIHAQTRVTQFMAAVLSRMTGVPHVSTCHGFFRPRLWRRIFPCWGRRVIAISDQVAVHLRRDFGVAPERIRVIRNGIDLHRFSPANPQRHAEYQERLGCGHRKVVGILARLSDVKGHHILIEALNLVKTDVPQVKLLIVGEGRQEAVLKRQVADSGLTEWVDFYPVVNQASDFLAAFDCFVMPSLQEGLGLSVMEAQAAGLPVIASRVGGIPSLIRDGETGILVPPGDVRHLARAIRRVLTDADLARRLGEQARHEAEQFYGAQEMAQAVLDVYRACDAG